MPILRVGYFWPAAVQLPRCPVTFSLIGVRFAADAALEGTGFEPSVPLAAVSFVEAHGLLLTPSWSKWDSNRWPHLQRGQPYAFAFWRPAAPAAIVFDPRERRLRAPGIPK